MGHTDSGNPRRITVYGRTQSEVLGKLDALRTQVGAVPLAPERLTVAELLERWIAHRTPDLRPSTVHTYEGAARRVDDQLGRLAVRRVTPLHIDAHLGRLRTAGLGSQRIRYVRAVLRMAFEQAVRWRLITFNPVAATAAPRRVRPETSAWTADEVRVFLDIARASVAHWPLYLLAVAAGLRRGELCGLRWSDLQGDRLRIDRAVVLWPGGRTEAPPKTARAARVIVLPPDVIEALEGWRAAQDRLRERAARWSETGAIFTGRDGRPRNPQLITIEFRRLAKRAGLRPIRLHDLRHTYATLALAAGQPLKVVSERLGHASPVFTLGVYADHVHDEERERGAISLEALLGKPSKPS